MSVSDRFWSKVNKSGPTPAHWPELGPCWIWTSGRNAAGYGSFWLGRKPNRGSNIMILAHRWSLQSYLGRAVFAGKYALHHCDNPACIRPSHLYEGTQSENMLDLGARGDPGLRAGVRNGHAKLTEELVRYVRSRKWRGPQVRLARELGVTQSLISKILRNDIWKLVEP